MFPYSLLSPLPKQPINSINTYHKFFIRDDFTFALPVMLGIYNLKDFFIHESIDTDDLYYDEEKNHHWDYIFDEN